MTNDAEAARELVRAIQECTEPHTAFDWNTTEQLILAAFAAVRQDERERIEHDVMKVVGGIAASHSWFPIKNVLGAIREMP